MKKIITTSFLLATLLSVSSLYAQVAQNQLTDTLTTSDTSTCVNLTRDLRFGSKDSTTGGQVSDLQFFLNDRGYLKNDPTGNFGGATLAAVKAFQADNSVPTTGTVGPLTRSKIVAVSCSTSANDEPLTPTSTTAGGGVSQSNSLSASLSYKGGDTNGNPVVVPSNSVAENINPLIPRTWVWSVTGATVVRASYAITGANCSISSHGMLAEPNWQPWIGASASGDKFSGTNTRSLGVSYYGCTISAKLTAINASGASVFSTIKVTFANQGQSNPVTYVCNGVTGTSPCTTTQTVARCTPQNFQWSDDFYNTVTIDGQARHLICNSSISTGAIGEKVALTAANGGQSNGTSWQNGYGKVTAECILNNGQAIWRVSPAGTKTCTETQSQTTQTTTTGTVDTTLTRSNAPGLVCATSPTVKGSATEQDVYSRNANGVLTLATTCTGNEGKLAGVSSLGIQCSTPSSSSDTGAACSPAGSIFINGQVTQWKNNTSGSCYSDSACENGYSCTNNFCSPKVQFSNDYGITAEQMPAGSDKAQYKRVWSGSSWGTWSFIKCLQGSHTEGQSTTCVPDTKSCTLANAVGTMTYNTTTSQWGACQYAQTNNNGTPTCNSGYFYDGQTCSPTTRSCVPSDNYPTQYPRGSAVATGVQTWSTLSGGSWNQCEVVCKTGYTLTTKYSSSGTNEFNLGSNTNISLVSSNAISYCQPTTGVGATGKLSFTSSTGFIKDSATVKTCSVPKGASSCGLTVSWTSTNSLSTSVSKFWATGSLLLGQTLSGNGIITDLKPTAGTTAYPFVVRLQAEPGTAGPFRESVTVGAECEAGSSWDGVTCVGGTTTTTPPVCTGNTHLVGTTCVSCPSSTQTWNGASCVTATVSQVPVITSFTVDKTQANVGDLLTFSWNAPGANGCTFANLTTFNQSSKTSPYTETAAAGTTQYRLTCANTAGYSTPATVTVTAGSGSVSQAPIVTSFAVDKPNANVGDRLTFTWVSPAGAACSIFDPVNNVYRSATSPYAQILAQSTTRYSLTCGVVGAASSPLYASVTVAAGASTANQKPVISSFKVDTQSATVGQMLNFTWASTGANGCTISATEGGMGLFSLPMSITTGGYSTKAYDQIATVTYRLVCSNTFGDSPVSTLAVTTSNSAGGGTVVTTPQVPVITSFTVDKTQANVGDLLTFSWNAPGANGCTFANLTTFNQSSKTSPYTETAAAGTTQYRLTCANTAGYSTPATVTVTAGQAVTTVPAPVARLTSTPSVVTYPSNILYSLSSTNALSCQVTGSDGVTYVPWTENTNQKTVNSNSTSPGVLTLSAQCASDYNGTGVKSQVITSSVTVNCPTGTVWDLAQVKCITSVSNAWCSGSLSSTNFFQSAPLTASYNSLGVTSVEYSLDNGVTYTAFVPTAGTKTNGSQTFPPMSVTPGTYSVSMRGKTSTGAVVNCSPSAIVFTSKL